MTLARDTDIDTSTSDTARERGPSSGGHRIDPVWLLGWAGITAATVALVAQRPLAGTLVALGCFVAPDLTMLIGAGEDLAQEHLSPRCVPYYNAVHRIGVPVALSVLGGLLLATGSTVVLLGLIGTLSWSAHIALDRTVGYGLRNADGSR